MGARLRLSYLVPQFPGQTHAFYWREVLALEVALLLTRPPPPGIVAHAWSAEAQRRTTDLASCSPWAARALCALPLRGLAGAERGLLRDLAVALPAAGALLAAALHQGIGHVHSCRWAALIAALAARPGGPSYNLTLHNPLAVYEPGQTLKWRGARFATAVNRKLLAEVRTALREDAPERIEVRTMCVDPTRFARLARYETSRSDEPLRLLSCGQLNPIKGHAELLAALRLLVDVGLHATLRIAGEDEEGGTGRRRAIERRVERDFDASRGAQALMSLTRVRPGKAPAP